MKEKVAIKIFIALVCFLIFVYAQSTESQYVIANKIPVSGDDGWDYLIMDESAGRLFISHGTQVQVLDVTKRTVVGTIPDTRGVHGIALAQDLNKGFISNGRDTSVTVFNLQTLAAIGKIKVTGRNPDAILYDSLTHRVLTFNGGSSNATVIDANTNEVIGTIKLDGKPEFAVMDGEGKLFVNIEDKSEVSRLNPLTMRVEQTWNVSPGEEPSGLAIDKITHRLFIVCDNKLMVIMDAQNGRVITTLLIGERVDGCAFDPGLRRVYSSNGEGTITVVQEENENKFSVIENVPTQRGARTITLDTKTHHLYLPTAEYLAAPAATTDNPHPRPPIKPGSFVVLDVKPVKE